MVYFDLNVPFLEKDVAVFAAAASSQDNAAARAVRLKVVVKAMELGYTGVAYNRTVRGVLCDSDRCKIPPFPLSSLLKVAPGLASSAKFHREILGVPLASPFRQYTRLTVAVDTPLGAAALNAGNPMLRTYDLVAVQPLNQTAFDQACKVSEVDLIAIDFSQRLPFRLKLPMVKAAIERGVFFEITYSHLIADVHIRRQMLPGAKLLVDWTRGKSLIFSSAASTVNELRGPYDVANLCTLLGLSMEKAKAAISKNCRSLVANSLRKRQCYKETIRVEKLSPSKQLESKQAWTVDWSNWDPISSGEGDLPPLDDIAKFFTASGKASSSVVKKEPGPSATTNAISQHNRFDQVSVEDDTALSIAHSEHQISDSEGDMVSLSDGGGLFSNAIVSEPTATGKEDSNILLELDAVSTATGKRSYGTPSKDCNTTSECGLMLPDDGEKLFTVGEDVGTSSICMGDPRNSDRTGAVSVALRALVDGTSLMDSVPCVEDVQLPSADVKVTITNSMEIDPSLISSKDAKEIDGRGIDLVAGDVPIVQVLTLRTLVDGTSLMDCVPCVEDVQLPSDDIKMTITNSMEIDPSLISSKEAKGIDGLGVDLVAGDVPIDQVLTQAEDLEEENLLMCPQDTPLQEDFAKAELTGQGDGRRSLAEDMPREKEYDEMKVQDVGNNISVTNSPLLEEEMGKNDRGKECCTAANGFRPQICKPGKFRCKRRLPFRPPAFPVNGVLKPLLFVKKIQDKRPRNGIPLLPAFPP